MKRICEFCGKEYEVDVSLGNWNKDNVQIIVHGKGSGNLISRSDKFCSFECGKKHIKNKIKNTFINNYGVENPFQSKEIKNKIKNTWLNNYGVDNPAKSKKVQQKIQNTCLERYNGIAPAKSKKVLLKMQDTCLQKYGVKNPYQSKEIQQIIKKTTLKKYGKESYSQTQEWKNKFNDKEWVKHQQERIDNTKKKNHTENFSSEEEQIYQLLLQKYSQVERQYKSKLYPWKCDFYIPVKDLYIEYQGTWTHGKEPYNKNNEEHIKQVIEWENRSIIKNYKNKRKDWYKIAIYVWTQLDPLKRQTAKDNNLNWIEFFNMEEFMRWYND